MAVNYIIINQPIDRLYKYSGNERTSQLNKYSRDLVFELSDWAKFP